MTRREFLEAIAAAMLVGIPLPGRGAHAADSLR